MKIIGEKINGTRKLVGKAIAERDASFIQSLAQKQVEGGAHWLDINAGTRPDLEPDDMVWLVNLVQEVTDVPLCLDSANPLALRAAMKIVKRTPMINSISGEPYRLEGIVPIAAEFQTPVITLCLDDKGIPATTEGRLEVLARVVEITRKAGIPDESLYIDPLVMTIATNTNAGNIIFETIRCIRQRYPDRAHGLRAEQRLLRAAGALADQPHFPGVGHRRRAGRGHHRPQRPRAAGGHACHRAAPGP